MDEIVGLEVLEANTVVEEAMSALAEDPTDDNKRIEFYKTLIDKYLAIPITVDSEGKITAYATKPNFLGEGEFLAGFTSMDQLKRSYPDTHFTILIMGTIFKLITGGNYPGLIINFDGEWIGITAEDIKRFFKF